MRQEGYGPGWGEYLSVKGRVFAVGDVLNLPGRTPVAHPWRIVAVEPDPDPYYNGRLYLEPALPSTEQPAPN
jgi:hypothetical protein